MVEAALRFRWALPVAIVLSLYAGWISQVGNFLSLSRTICFFPFFLAGYLLPKTGLERVRNVRKIFPIMAFAAAMAGTFVIFYTNVPYKIFFMNGNYRLLGQGKLEGMMFRSLALLIGFLCIFFFLSVLPKRKTIFSSFGRYSITIYLGHSVIIRLLKQLRITKGIGNPALFIGVDILLALILCFVLGNRKVAQGYQAVMGKISKVLVP